MSDVGSMRHRVTLQSPPTALDAMNEPNGDWTTVGTFFAHVEPLGGRELFNARQLKATSTHKITMRGGTPVRPSQRLVFEGTGRVFGIDNVNRVDERTAYMTLMVTEDVQPQ